MPVVHLDWCLGLLSDEVGALPYLHHLQRPPGFPLQQEQLLHRPPHHLVLPIVHIPPNLGDLPIERGVPEMLLVQVKGSKLLPIVVGVEEDLFELGEVGEDG